MAEVISEGFTTPLGFCSGFSWATCYPSSSNGQKTGFFLPQRIGSFLGPHPPGPNCGDLAFPLAPSVLLPSEGWGGVRLRKRRDTRPEEGRKVDQLRDGEGGGMNRG